MKTIKKLTALILALIFCLSLAACGDKVSKESAKYIPGGTQFGMSTKQVIDTRGEGPYGTTVGENSIYTKQYGHTCLHESFADSAIEDFCGEEINTKMAASITYHMDKNLYSVEVYLSFDSQSDLEDAFYALGGKYNELFGEDPEWEEYSTYGAKATWENKTAKVTLDAWQGGTKTVTLYVTKPGKAHPEK